jgi:hypothetical protein
MSRLLPTKHRFSHSLAFYYHDLILESYLSGLRNHIFTVKIKFANQADCEDCERNSADILDWMENTGRIKESNDLIYRMVCHGLISDFCHFIYEALSCSEKGKLAVSFSLLRKPLNENLFQIESLVIEQDDFINKLRKDPCLLLKHHVPNLKSHNERIFKVLEKIDKTDFYESQFITELRFNKKSDDSFDGAWNKALHLFTHYESIKTEPLNINFVFSQAPELESQWSYLYARLPYLLSYAKDVIDYLIESICSTEPWWIQMMNRRSAAGNIIWAESLEESFKHPAIDKFKQASELYLRQFSDKKIEHALRNRKKLMDIFCGKGNHKPPKGKIRNRSTGLLTY